MNGKYNQERIMPSQLIKRNFPYEPTSGQYHFFDKMNDFLMDNSTFSTFILKGFAGTGKTSIISALVKSLPSLNLKSLLLAPTGRAAKVMGNYSGKSAFTIHKIIYQADQNGEAELKFALRKNYNRNTLFIVDESSMITDDGGNSGNLLRDLIRFVFENQSNRLMLVGDTAQLPPVKSNSSPGLDINYLKSKYNLHAHETELSEVMRQQLNSGILFNATNLRDEIKKEIPSISFVSKGFKDFFKMTSEQLEEGLRYAYNKFGVENTIVITRSNKLAVQYNQFIRQSIHFYEEEINSGDILMIVKNNYTYMAESEKVNFLANGDFVEVTKIRSFEEIYGLRFATLELRLIDYPDEPYFEAKVILDTLHSDSPGLSSEQSKSLYNQVLEDYKYISNKSDRMEMIKKDVYLSALQIKFAYALTCHKAQGGQWEGVFVDQGYLKEEQIDKEYLRWLYTAVTRATKELFMVNFHPRFYNNN